MNLKNTKKARRVYHSTPKKGTRNHKRFGKSGIFLRKKAWKNNSFLAFLPREVAKDESLLENVYNMLSQMLQNLRKHKKNTKTSHSMKTLKQYLKLPGNEYQEKPIEKLSPKARHESTESLSGSESFPKVTSKLRKSAKKLKLEELGSILHGQKQLDKEANDQRHPISKNPQWHSAKVMYLPRDNTSKVSSNESFSDSHVAGKPSYVYKVIVRPETATSNDAVTSTFPGTLDSRLRNHSANEYDSGLGTPPPPDFRRNSSTSFEEDNRSESKVYRNASEDNRNVSDDHQNQSEDHRNESNDYRNESKKIQGHNKSFENGNKEYLKNKSSKSRNWLKSRTKDRKNWQKPRTSKTGFSNVSLRKPRGGKKKLNSASKLKGNTILKIDAPLVKVMKTNSTSNVIVERSDEDIISSIVQVLEKEQNKRAERKRRRKYTSAKNKYSQGHRGNLTIHMKRISKKDPVQKNPRKDPTLMEEEEDYKVLKI